MTAVKSVLLKYGIEVFQPRNIEGLNQIFSRDIGFVIDKNLLYLISLTIGKKK